MVTSMDLASSLHGLRLPCDKQNLIEYASRQGGSQEVVALLQRLPERRFNSLAEVWSLAGEVS